jgi:hypothetical protein
MATQLCQKCKQAHPGRVCDYDDKAECAETISVNEVAQPRNEPSKRRGRLRGRYEPEQLSARLTMLRRCTRCRSVEFKLQREEPSPLKE